MSNDIYAGEYDKMKKSFIKNSVFPNKNFKNNPKRDKTTNIVSMTSSSHVSVNSRPVTHIEYKKKKKVFKQVKSQTDGSKQYGAAVIMKAGSLPKQARPQKQKESGERESITVKVKKQTQTQQLSEKSSLPSLKQTQSNECSSNDTTVQTKKGEPASEKHKKRKNNSKKSHDGSSNWMKLCAKLNIEASVRKTKPLKRPAPDSHTESHHSEPKRSKPGIWFDNVDKILIEADSTNTGPGDSRTLKEGSKVTDTEDQLVKPDSFKGITNCVAMDCEMVGVGPNGEESILARVSLVNHFGVCLYDKFVLPREKVTDYRTYVSGVTAENLATGEEFTKVQKEVSDLLKGRILVGHAVHNDLKVLFLTHPHKMIRDTSLYKPFRELFKGRLPSLKKLTEKVLGVQVQEGQHSSVQDAQATMRLYTLYRQKWEKELRKDRKMNRKRKKKKKQQKKENV